MSVRVNIPVRVRVDRQALETRLEDLEQTAAAAAERAMASSVDVVLAPRGDYLRTCLRAPTFTWGGPDLAGVPGALRRRLEGFLADALYRAARRAGVTDWGTHADEAPEVLPQDPSEKFDQTRYNWRTGLYEVSSYDAAPKEEKKQVPLGEKPSATPASGAPDWASVAAGLRDPNDVKSASAFYEIRQLVLAWDKYAVAVVMLGLRADGSAPTFLVMRALRRLAQQDPGRFRALLRELRAGYEGANAAWFERGEDDIIIVPASGATVDAARALYDVLGGLIYAARAIPEARPVADEWEASARGLGRIGALLGALAAARGELSRYLAVPLGNPAGQVLSTVPTGAQAPRFESTDPGVMARIHADTALLLRYQALALIQAHQSGQQDFAYQLQLDLVENIRLIDETRSHVQWLDSMLQGLGLLYGAGARHLEETKVLREIRAELLLIVAQGPVWTAARAVSLREAQEKRLADWIGTASDRRLEQLRRNYASLVEEAAKLRISATQADGSGMTTDDRAYNDLLYRFRTEVKVLERDMAAMRVGARNTSYLAAVNELEHRAANVAARLVALNTWWASLQILRDLWWKDIGRESERAAWKKEADDIFYEVILQYASPDFSSLNKSVISWRMRLDYMVDQIRDVVRRENNRQVLIFLGALVATALTGGALAGIGVSAITITLGEALTFTAVSTVGRGVLLGKSVGVGEVVKEFATNVATFGVFRVLNIALLAGARRLFPRQAFLQFATVAAGNAAIAAAPVLLSDLDRGKWSDNATSLLIGALIVHVIGASLLNQPAGLAKPEPELLTQLRGLLVAKDVVDRLATLAAKNAALGAEWRTAVASGRLDQELAASIQRRAVQLADESAAAARRLAASGITDQQLGALKLPGAAGLNTLADFATEYGAALRAMPNAGQVASRALLPPTEVVREGLIVAGNRIEYNPKNAATRPRALVRRFLDAGYMVTEDAGVLRLIAPGEDVPRYLLLPAGADLPPPALARLVTPPGPGAAEVLQKSQTNAAKGLRIVQAQNAVPSLEQRLTSVAASDPDAVKALLVGMGRHVPETEVRAIQGIAHFLEIGGNPRTLAVALGLGDRTWSAEIRATLGKFNALNESQAKDLDVIVKVRGGHAAGTDSIAGIGAHHPDPGPIYSAVAELEPSTEKGLDPLIRQLASDSLAMRQEAIDALQKARDILGRGATPRLQFSRRTVGGVEALRVSDASGKASVPSIDQPAPEAILRVKVDIGKAPAGSSVGALDIGTPKQSGFDPTAYDPMRPKTGQISPKVFEERVGQALSQATGLGLPTKGPKGKLPNTAAVDLLVREPKITIVGQQGDPWKEPDFVLFRGGRIEVFEATLDAKFELGTRAPGSTVSHKRSQFAGNIRGLAEKYPGAPITYNFVTPQALSKEIKSTLDVELSNLRKELAAAGLANPIEVIWRSW